MSDLTEVDGCLAEGARLIREADACVRRLHQADACEGHRQMAAATLVAMRHVYLLMETQRDRSVMETTPLPVGRPAPEKRRWWLLLSRRRGHRSIHV